MRTIKITLWKCGVHRTQVYSFAISFMLDSTQVSLSESKQQQSTSELLQFNIKQVMKWKLN